MKVGDRVKAVERITETGFLGQDLFVHAEPGAPGMVQIVDGEFLTVTFAGGTTTDVHRSEVAPVRAGIVNRTAAN